MRELKELDKLWGTTIYNIVMDDYLKCVRFYIKVFSEDILKFYEISFEKILKFHMNYQSTRPRHYSELTEIYYSKEKNYKFCLLIWSEDYTIDIECEDWKLTLLQEYNENE